MARITVEAVTEVAESVAAMVGEETVGAMPPFPVGGVEGIDVDVSAIAVEWVAPRRRAEAVDADTFIGEPAEDVADATICPVLVDDQLRKWPSPVGEVQLPSTFGAAVVGLEPLPGLKSPVA